MPSTDRFLPPDQFRSTSRGYRLTPFRFARLPDASGEVLVVNEVGEFLFLEERIFRKFCAGELAPDEFAYQDLRSRHFLLDSHADAYWPYAVSQYRTRKDFVHEGPALHLVVVTLRCDHSCPYCQVSRKTVDRDAFDLSVSNSLLVVDRILESRAKNLKVEFQGGEPLLAFDRIRLIVETLEQRIADTDRSIDFVIATTLSTITDEQLTFCREHRIGISTSLDGPEALHNGNRPRSGRDSYQLTVDGIRRAREMLGHSAVSALTTLTKNSLRYPREIIDAYVERGFVSVSLRPLSHYGFAVQNKDRLGYSVAEFLRFYDDALEHLIELNVAGTRIEESYTSTLLQHICTPFPTGYVDLRSPTGAMFGALAYNYDGRVYASDEGRMLAETGDTQFCLGHVSQTRATLLSSQAARAIADSCLAESLPGCSDCAFLPYCGADPVGNVADQGTLQGHRPTSRFCERQTGLFHRLFRILRQPNSQSAQVILSWLTHQAPKLSTSTNVGLPSS